MQVLEKKREEIEARVNTMSDFLKMEYLESCLKANLDINVCKYCYKKLSELYENKIMYPEAVKNMARFEELCAGEMEKIAAIVKEAELLIKAGKYEPAEYLYKKAMSLADESKKYEIKRSMIRFYEQEAMNFEKMNKQAGALKIYERLVNLVTDAEKTQVKKRMFELYQKLGKVKEYIRLKAEMDKES